MLALLKQLLPEKYKAYVTLGLRLFNNLNTAEERNAAIKYLLEATESGGYCSITEWATFGKMTGFVGKPKNQLTKMYFTDTLIIIKNGDGEGGQYD